MTTETKAPTTEDVKQWCQETLDGTTLRTRTASDRISRLRDLALLGVQVPGLVADVAALQRDLQATHDAARHEKDRADANEHSAFAKASALGDATREVSALQARVAELEEQKAALLNMEPVREARDARAERDALREQVERLTTSGAPIVMWAASKLNLRPGPDNTSALAFGFSVVQYGHLRAFVAAHDAALSTPPAETKGLDVPAGFRDATTSDNWNATAEAKSEPVTPWGPPDHCAADRDGECSHANCPQRTNYQSYCPLARADEAAAERDE